MAPTDRRDAILQRVADHLLDHGLAGASLRPMAAAAGTSDRMLLYYFPDREALLAAALERIAGEMAARLDAAVPPGPYAWPDLLRRLRAALATPALGRYMQLWLEAAARSARGERPYPAIGRAIGLGFLAWAAGRLAGADPAVREAEAALMLATLDGLALLDSVGLRDAADRAAAVV